MDGNLKIRIDRKIEIVFANHMIIIVQFIFSFLAKILLLLDGTIQLLISNVKLNVLIIASHGW